MTEPFVQCRTIMCNVARFVKRRVARPRSVRSGHVFADLLAHWGLERPHVVAHDFGGAVSLRAHLLHGATFASLALIDVVALRPWGSPFFSLVNNHAEVFGQLGLGLEAEKTRSSGLLATRIYRKPAATSL